MHCRVCGQPGPVPLWSDTVDPALSWARCLACGSDTSSVDPAVPARDYQTESYRDHLHNPGGDPTSAALAANVRWFGDYRGTVPGPDFLDVGHLNGAALMAMQDAGWRVHGFDVNPSCDFGPHTTIAPAFLSGLFPRQYDAVLCKDVVEHVETWRHLIQELFLVTKPRGLCQVQTPRPTASADPLVHQRHHLQVFSVAALDLEIRRVGFELQDRWLWPNGQALLLRRPG